MLQYFYIIVLFVNVVFASVVVLTVALFCIEEVSKNVTARKAWSLAYENVFYGYQWQFV